MQTSADRSSNDVHPGRWSAHVERFEQEPSTSEAVVFLIGMRVNNLWRIRDWLPVASAMPKMLKELSAAPHLGLRGFRSYVSGRVIMVVQYWDSVEQLQAYARASSSEHLPAWQAYNRKIGASSTVGVWHETYTLQPGSYETIYANMPVFGLAKAFQHLPTSDVGHSAAKRMGRSQHDKPAVPAP